MTDYAKIKKLDEKSLQQLKEGSGPADECLCSILSPPEVKKGFTASVKKVFRSMSRAGRKGNGWPVGGQWNGEIPLDLSMNQSGVLAAKEVLNGRKSCGKCGCDSDKITLKHSLANIRITTPDVSTICPCQSDCFPDKQKLQSSIKVFVENAQIVSRPNFEKGLSVTDSPTDSQQNLTK